MNLEINLIFLIKSFFREDRKVMIKTLNILRTKMKQKAFFIMFIGLSMKQTHKFFLEGESPTLNQSLFWTLGGMIAFLGQIF